MSETIQKDAQNAQAEKNDGAQTAQGAAADKTLFDPEVQLQKFSRGKIRLATPILASDKDVTELIYDFAALTGRAVAALDKGGAVGMNAFRITDTQAFELFAAAAEKRRRASTRRTSASAWALWTAKGGAAGNGFFSAANRAGNRRISNV
ncbi:MAG: hypothetical protein ACLUI3_00270 [Christensenellales bacterium]